MADSLEPRRNLRTTAGDDETFDVTVPVDLTGATVRYAVTDGRGGTTLAGPYDDGDPQVNITSTGANQSTFSITLPSSDTTGLLGEYWHEAEYELSGDTTTAFTGAVIVRPDTV